MSKKYLIVGGSSGIGLALTNRLAKEGNTVFVLSRNQNQLEISDKIIYHKIDVLDQPQSFLHLNMNLTGLHIVPAQSL